MSARSNSISAAIILCSFLSFLLLTAARVNRYDTSRKCNGNEAESYVEWESVAWSVLGLILLRTDYASEVTKSIDTKYKSTHTRFRSVSSQPYYSKWRRDVATEEKNAKASVFFTIRTYSYCDDESYKANNKTIKNMKATLVPGRYVSK